jgi:hypothetical protein
MGRAALALVGRPSPDSKTIRSRSSCVSLQPSGWCPAASAPANHRLRSLRLLTQRQEVRLLVLFELKKIRRRY